MAAVRPICRAHGLAPRSPDEVTFPLEMLDRSRRRFGVGALALVAAAAGPVSSPRAARADDVASGAANESGVIDPAQDAQVGLAGDTYADTDPSSLTDFEPALDPHGTWVDDPTYGTVWAPNPNEVGADFTPYVSAGHWAYDDSYFWVSDYTWGWVAFHYGRWIWIADRGWAWIPGRLYADAWVVWRIGDGTTAYVGWAPMPPTWGWRGGVAGLFGFVAWEPFVFCSSHELFAPNVAPWVVTGDPATTIASHTRPYVTASPVVGAPFSPRSATQGPPLAALGIEASRVVHLARTDPGQMRARQFARPSTALALGGRAPVPHVVRPKLVTQPYAIQRTLPHPARRK
jgi:hypothetical protein